MKRYATDINDIFEDIPRLDEAILRYKVYGVLNISEIEKALKPSIGLVNLVNTSDSACLDCILSSYQENDRICSDTADCRTYDDVLNKYFGGILNESIGSTKKYLVYFKDPTR